MARSPDHAASARALHSRCWSAAIHHDLLTLLDLARDPALTSEMVATIAPPSRERDADVTLVRLVLEHPSISRGVVGRYAVHSDPEIRLLVARHPRVPRTALDGLEVDRDERVRRAAQEALRAAR